MTDDDFPTPPSEPSRDAPEESPSLPDIDELFPMIPHAGSPSEESPADDSASQEEQELTELGKQKDVAETFESITSDEVGESMEIPPEAEDVQESTEDSAEENAQPELTGPTVVVRYGLMGFLGEFRYNQKRPIRSGVKVVVRTDRGVELGEVVSVVDRTNPNKTDEQCSCSACPGLSITPEGLNKFLKTSSENYPFRRGGRVLRIANPQDLIDFRHLSTSADEESKYCREQIKERNLPMRLVKAEHMLGGERIVFYFTAESRVDFRSLVRDLASQFRTRIEMRQVGARDEARLVADYERCGRPCCCREFLKDLKPVSMRMAKVQKATLDPTKISGRCGRLMCCLRYEDECYEELKKSLPRRNTWVRTKSHIGCVVDGQIITQLVRLSLYDGTFAVVGVEEILERNIEPPTEEELREHAAKQAQAQRNEARKLAEQEAAAAIPMIAPAESPLDLDAEQESSVAPSPEESEKTSEETNKKRRRRRRRKPSGNAKSSQGQNANKNRQPSSQPSSRQKDNQQKSSSEGQDGGKSNKKRRGRRRRKPKPGGGNTGGSNNGA